MMKGTGRLSLPKFQVEIGRRGTWSRDTAKVLILSPKEITSVSVFQIFLSRLLGKRPDGYHERGRPSKENKDMDFASNVFALTTEAHRTGAITADGGQTVEAVSLQATPDN